MPACGSAGGKGYSRRCRRNCGGCIGWADPAIEIAATESAKSNSVHSCLAWPDTLEVSSAEPAASHYSAPSADSPRRYEGGLRAFVAAISIAGPTPKNPPACLEEFLWAEAE